MFFPAKLLLFGEYAIVTGGLGLAVPFEQKGGEWAFARQNVLKQQTISASQEAILAFAAYLKQLEQEEKLLMSIDLAALEKDVLRGYYFDSSIPMGYGLGSSGALIAAIYHHYVAKRPTKKLDSTALKQLRSHFAIMESFFHGKSSGIDPLVSYLDHSILILADGNLEMIDFRLSQVNCPLFLYDTCMERNTGPLVNHFLSKMKEEAYAKACQETLTEINQNCIQALLADDTPKLWDNMQRLSQFQQVYFDRMIPEAIRPLWQKGLESQIFSFKICGAGGGGMMIGLAQSADVLGSMVEKERVLFL